MEKKVLRLTTTWCLMGSILMFWLLKKRFCIRFSAIAHLQKAPITASSEHVPVSQSSVYRLKQFHLKQNVLNAHIRKKYTLLNIPFVNKWNNVKNGKSVVKTTAKMLDQCYIWSFIVIFMD